MKKAFFKLMLVVLGLNVFTACYGPAPGNWEYGDDEVAVAEEQADEAEGTAEAGGSADGQE